METLWVPILVGVMGIAGTLIGVGLTQRNANHREDIRWEREAARQELDVRRQRDEAHAVWLRDQRLEAYAELVELAGDFWMELVPLIDVLERQDDSSSTLNQTRNALFAAVGRCKLLGGAEVQLALHQLGDAAENVGHRPYADDPSRESRWRHELLRDAQIAHRRVEDAIRAELGLSPRVPYDAYLASPTL